MEAKLLLQLKGRQHFVESSDIYTMRDLIDIHNDALLPELAQVHTSWAQHIKTDCEVGYIEEQNVTYLLSSVMRKPEFCLCEKKDADLPS